jgi:hypothetical protein
VPYTATYALGSVRAPKAEASDDRRNGRRAVAPERARQYARLSVWLLLVCHAVTERQPETAGQRSSAKGIQFLIGPLNSSVGLANLGLYRGNHVLPLCTTSSEQAAAFGVTASRANEGVSSRRP